MGGFLRWSRVRGLVEGLMQRGRAEGYANEAGDGVPRPQDYGFAGNPVAGQALYLEIDGQPVLLRLDILDKRPRLEPLEVAVWHSEGHFIKLKARGVVEVKGARLVIEMSDAVDIQAPALTHNGKNVGDTHAHGGVERGPDASGGPQ